MAADIAMDDMDIDMEFDPEIARLNAEADAIAARVQAEDIEAMNGVEEVPEEGEVDSSAPAPTKVHIRGLDHFNTHDMEKYAEEHYSMDLFKKVQWIDDTSANFIYDTEVATAEALMAFSEEEVSDSLQLREAKRLSTHPDVVLQVRQAIEADVKIPGAAKVSKFYLFNKEWDPESRGQYRKRRRADDGYGANKYRRRDYENDRHYPRESRDQGHFHEDMYGDDPQAPEEARRNSHSAAENSRRGAHYGEDLVARRSNDRLRNRSASPGREGDGRYGFEESQPRRRTPRPRSRTPPGVRAGRDNRNAREDLRKELFPGKKPTSALANGHNNDSFSVPRPSSSSSSRELFPDKLSGTMHRRQDAKHMGPDEIADAIGKYSFDGSYEPRTYSRSGRRPENDESNRRGEGTDLFARINGGPKVEASYGRLHDRPPVNSSAAGFSIKGAGRVDDAGFSILGASRERAQNPLVKELFPVKTGSGNGGRDLFDGRIKGRGVRRNRAEDLF